MSDRYNCFICGEWEEESNLITPDELRLRDSEYVHQDEWQDLPEKTRKLLAEASSSMKHYDWSGLPRPEKPKQRKARI